MNSSIASLRCFGQGSLCCYDRGKTLFQLGYLHLQGLNAVCQFGNLFTGTEKGAFCPDDSLVTLRTNACSTSMEPLLAATNTKQLFVFFNSDRLTTDIAGFTVSSDLCQALLLLWRHNVDSLFFIPYCT